MFELQNDRLIKALLRQPVDKTPIWIMRQAGRYLPEYRELRANAGSFLNLCKTPELACEATLQPLARFDLDAAILFSDILTIPEAQNLGLYFVEGKGPQIENPVRTKADITKLGIPDPEKELGYVCDAVRLIQKALAGKVPLIGFAGSPWTIATYMVEGCATKEFSVIKSLIYNDPDSAHLLLSKLAEAVTLYLNAQIAAGVNAVMIFDTWGGILTRRDYRDFSLNYMQQIIDGLDRERDGQTIPVTLFTKNAGLWLEMIAETGCDAVGLDWTIDIADAKCRVGSKVALQGNLDPSVLFATPERIREEATLILNAFGEGAGHVFNLGHGINKDTPPENVAALVDAVHGYSSLRAE